MRRNFDRIPRLTLISLKAETVSVEKTVYILFLKNVAK